MRSALNRIEDLLTLSVIIGLIVFVLSIVTVMQWKQDGLELIEVSFMPILSGLYFLIISIIANAIGLNKYIRNSLKNSIVPIKRIFQVLIVLTFSFIVFLLIDSVIFLIDDSISVEYANSLMELSEKSGGPIDRNGIEDFARLPFALQNGIITLIFAFIGSMISLAFIKKNGVLIGSTSI